VEELIGRVRALWESLGPGASFAPAPRAAVVPGSRMCPPGWAGLVVIGGQVLITAPDQRAAGLIEDALSGVPLDAITSAEVLRRRLPVAELRGPARLAYLDPAGFRPERGIEAVPMDPGQPGFRQFLAAVSPADREECGLDDITSPAFVIQERGRVVAAAGYQGWPEQTAHLSLLTAPAARHRGLGRAAASAAVAHALAHQRLPQWRARVEASRRVARALGFRDLGAQVSLGLRPPEVVG
jgi:RimJ/RimL family protein N-acetyltransferase